MRGRLATQIRSKEASASANDGFSKERIWPHNYKNANNDASPTWVHGSEDTNVEMEMGLPMHGPGYGGRDGRGMRS